MLVTRVFVLLSAGRCNKFVTVWTLTALLGQDCPGGVASHAIIIMTVEESFSLFCRDMPDTAGLTLQLFALNRDLRDVPNTTQHASIIKFCKLHDPFSSQNWVQSNYFNCETVTAAEILRQGRLEWRVCWTIRLVACVCTAVYMYSVQCTVQGRHWTLTPIYMSPSVQI